MADALREPSGLSRNCPADAAPRGGGVQARAVPAPAVVVLPAPYPGGYQRWIAPLACGDAAREYRAWFSLATETALGLAVLGGRAHIAFGTSSGGAFWPGAAADFAPADGVWVVRNGSLSRETW